MNRPPFFNREGCLALVVYGGIAAVVGYVCGALAARLWGATTGWFIAGVIFALVVLQLCCCYTGAER